jgi:ElaB/YqjD/DUF883 family membrane-anchored ribosome-binding protein
MSTQQSRQQPKQRRGEEGAVNPTVGDRRRTDSATGGAETITSQVTDALDQQVVKGARTITKVARSARRAADELENDAPQVASLVRGVADRVEEYSRSLENQSVTDIYHAANNFTRRQPAVVFGVAALAGFFALRTLKSSATSEGRSRVRSQGGDEFHGS